MTIRLNLKTIGIALLALALLWHLSVALMSKVRVSGVFLAKPANPGYIWAGTDNADARFLWQITDVLWMPQVPHPDFSCETSPQEGIWEPLPGYAFADKSQGLNTAWKEGLKHPDFMAWSDDVEGQWIPVTGYKFIYEGDTFIDTVWDPNQRYDDVKVISMTEKDNYMPFPGYAFTEPGQSLKVVWMPGTVNPDNSRLIAGTAEGSWNVKPGGYSSRPRSENEAAAFFLGRVLYHAL